MTCRLAFGRIVCGVDGSRSSHIGVDQSIALCEPATALAFVCVRETRGAGATRQATITAERADEALEEAVTAAREAGIDAAAEARRTTTYAGCCSMRLLVPTFSSSPATAAREPAESRLAARASAAVHRARVPVLVARRPPEGAAFPERILVATDGSADAERAVELTARIGHRHRSRVLLLSVEPGPHGDPKRIAVDAVNLAAELGGDPTVLRASGHADEHILQVATSESVSLVAVGSRGLTGVRALGSVSERVAHRAHCSVLVARPA